MSTLVRDFSQSTQQTITSLIQADHDKNNEHIWSGLQDFVADHVHYHFTDINIEDYANNINSYYAKIIDANDISKKEYDKLIQKVYAIDQNYSAKFNIILSELTSFKNIIDSINSCFTFDASGKQPIATMDLTKCTYDKGMYTSAVIDTLLNNIKNYNSKYNNVINPSFDSDGSYGGNQGYPEGHIKIGTQEFNDLAAIIRSHKKYANYSDKEIEALLKTMNNTGCGYIALTNTIFDRYLGREKEFELTFGYPMYDSSGELNFNAVFADLYCYSGKESSTSRSSRERIWEGFCNSHGIDVDVRNIKNVNKDNIDKLMMDGQIIVRAEKVVLENEDGSKYDDCGDGHAMTLTGIADDGRLIVSSWGKKFYITRKKKSVPIIGIFGAKYDPYDIEFQIVDYK